MVPFSSHQKPWSAVGAHLIESWKRERRTLCRLSPAGRERFLAYVSELERVVSDAARARGVEGDAAAGYSPA